MNLAWLDEYLLPITMIVLVFALLWLAITRAKEAKREATQDAETSMPSAAQSQLSDIRQGVELVADAEPATAPSRRYPLIRQLTFGFGAVAIVFGFATCVIVFGSISRVYEKELTSRTQIITIGLSDLVTRRLATKSVQGLANDVEKYAAMKAVAYVYVENAKGAIIANAPEKLPRYLIETFQGQRSGRSAASICAIAVRTYTKLPIESAASIRASFTWGFGATRSPRRRAWRSCRWWQGSSC